MHAVIFDIDGTLLHSAAVDDALYRQAVGDTFGDVKLRGSLHDYEYITDTGILWSILEDNEMERDERHVGAIRSRFVELLEQHVARSGPFREIAGACDMIDALRASPVHAVAMATGGWRESAELKLRTAGVEFDGIPLVTSDDHHERTAIMGLALERLGAGFESVTYYGDGPWDRAACVELGWHFVAVGASLEGLESYIGHTPIFDNVRAMSEADMDAIFHVRTSVEHNHMNMQQLANVGITPDSVVAMLQSGEVRGWCAEAAGEVVGFSLATAETREINALFVLPDCSGRGLGQALLDIAVHYLKRTAPGMVRLRTDPRMPAYGFYRKRGWQDTGERHENGEDVFMELE